jgi:predicted neuraminidase
MTPKSSSSSIVIPAGNLLLLLPLLLLAPIAHPQKPAPASKPVSEFIFPIGSTSFPESHASTIVVLKNGDLMAAWFGGTKERNPDVAIWGSRRVAGKWSVPVELEREPNVPSWNPVLFHTADGRLWLYAKVGPSPGGWHGVRRFSDDEGLTWSPREDLPTGFLGPVRAKPLILADGTIVAGSSVEGNGWNVWIERSSDNARTWTKFGPITVPKDLDAATKPWPEPEPDSVSMKPGSDAKPVKRKYDGIIQPSVIQLEPHHLRFYARSQTLAMKVAIADSMDDGKTWTQARYIDVPQNNSGLDVIKLKDGRIVMIYNDTSDGRSPLNLAISSDGEHFRMFRTLEDIVGQYSYPAIVEGPDGGLEITYTWQRKTIKYVHVPLSEIPKP